jgi:hypothetical protein
VLDGSPAPLLRGAPPPDPATLAATFRRFGALLLEARDAARRRGSGAAPGWSERDGLAAEAAVMAAGHRLMQEVRARGAAGVCRAALRWLLGAGRRACSVRGRVPGAARGGCWALLGPAHQAVLQGPGASFHSSVLLGATC